MRCFNPVILRTTLLFFILIFYIWTGTVGSFTFNLKKDYYSYISLLSDAFLNGKLNLPIDPPPGLLALPDPYDSVANSPYRWGGFHDLSLYKDKLYLYFGPTPVLTLYIPYRLLTKRNMPDNLAILVFTFGSLIWSVLILSHLKNKYFKQAPEFIMLVSIFTIAMANVGPFLLRCPAIYEVAISSACFFLTGAIYFLCLTVSNANPNLKMLALSSLFLGLATGARFYFIIASVLLILLIWFIKYKQDFGWEGLFKTRLGKFLTIPFLTCLSLLLIYNYLRFENLIETGNKYQLTGFKATYGDYQSIIPNLYYYLFQAPTINSTFPFIHADYWKSAFFMQDGSSRVIGLIPAVPFITLIFLIPLIYFLISSYSFNRPDKKDTTFPYLEFWIIFTPFCINFVSLLTFQYVTIRYMADYLSLLILVNCLVWFYFDSILANQTMSKWFLRLLAILLAIISSLYGVAFSIIGLNHGLNIQNPEEYKKIESWFNPVSDILSKIIH